MTDTEMKLALIKLMADLAHEVLEEFKKEQDRQHEDALWEAIKPDPIKKEKK